jgi:sporulation protein YlmC with PRC-barrel domain
MLRSLKNLERYKVSAADGDVGSVDDFLVDDARWTVRYLVVGTGSFLDEREVLITPIAFREVDYSASRIRLSISMDKVKNSPSINLDLPVSRQYEKDYYGYYGYPYYWGFGGLWGTGGYPGEMASGTCESSPDRPGEPAADRHLRSAKDVTGYHVEGTDGSIGHVKDFVIDDHTWEVRYLVVDTTNWWFGKSVLVAPEWATRISWLDRKIYLGRTRDEIKRSPEWSATYPVEPGYEDALHRHYAGLPGWVGRDRNVLASSTPAHGKVGITSGEGVDGRAVEGASDRVAAYEEAQVRTADRAVVRDAREGRMP